MPSPAAKGHTPPGFVGSEGFTALLQVNAPTAHGAPHPANKNGGTLSAPSRVDSAVKPAAAHRLLASPISPERACTISTGRGNPLLPYSVGSSLFCKTTSQSNAFALGSTVIPPSHLPSSSAKRLPFSVCAGLKIGLSARPHLFSRVSFDARLKSPFARQQLKIRGALCPLVAVGRQPDSQSCSPLKAHPTGKSLCAPAPPPKGTQTRQRPGPSIAGHTLLPFSPSCLPMGGNNGVAVRIYRYGAAVYPHIPVLAGSGDGSAGGDYLLPAPLHHIICVQGEVPFDPRSAPRRRVQPLQLGEQLPCLLRPTQAISKLCE